MPRTDTAARSRTRSRTRTRGRIRANIRTLILAAAAAIFATAVWAEGGYYPDDERPVFSSSPLDTPGGGSTAIPGQGRAPRVAVTDGARYEWIVIGPAGEADMVQRLIAEAGGTVTRSRSLNALGEVTTIATFPGEAARSRAQEAIGGGAPRSVLASNQLYFFAQAANPRIYAPVLIGDGGPGRCRVASPVAIGMIDGPVNTGHPALRGVDVTHESLVAGSAVPRPDHGTAVAVLLVGEDPSGLLAGFARGARLHAISVFAQRDGAEEASVERIAEAIDRLAGQGVRLINLSLAGPENAALGRAVAAAARQGVVLVAASGNERRPVIAWPAAAPEVIAVTAVDASRRRFRMANTGSELEFSAPGVDVYAARERGAGYVSGTSFAAPIVTALAARAMASGRSSTEAIREVLRSGVEPLGGGSRNPDFGYGLVRSGGC
ncbi:MAG: S8 family serine peptidase [Pararhodobacter sp.]